MTAEPATSLDSTLEYVLRLLTTARSAATADPQMAGDLREVELTIHEVIDAADPYVVADIDTTYDALRAAETALDGISARQRPLWLLPLRAELAILRRRSAA